MADAPVQHVVKDPTSPQGKPQKYLFYIINAQGDSQIIATNTVAQLESVEGNADRAKADAAAKLALIAALPA